MLDVEMTRAAFRTAATMIRDSILGFGLGLVLLIAACGSVCAIAATDLAGRVRIGLHGAAAQDPE